MTLTELRSLRPGGQYAAPINLTSKGTAAADRGRRAATAKFEYL